MDAILFVFSVILVILTLLYFNIKRSYNYWKKKNVVHEKPRFFLGNYGEFLLQREYIGKTLQKLCNKFPHEPYIGAYIGTKPVLIIQDPEVVKLVLTKEFSHFTSRESMDHIHKEILGRGLILAHGEDWKFTRTNLTPMFSTLKLKNMFHLIEKCAVDFEKYLDSDIKDTPIEARDFMAKYTMFCFVGCAFGIDLKNFGKRNEFMDLGDKFFDFNWLRGLVFSIRMIWPDIFYGLGLRSIPNELSIFFRKLLSEVFESRNYKASSRNDFVDALLNLKENFGETKSIVDDDYLIAQCLAIFAGGFETSAKAQSFTLFELALNKEIQAKVHQEIDEYLKKTNGAITFDCINDLPYLDACLNESLRKYPIIGNLTREVTKTFTMPSGVVLERGLRVHIPMYHLHHNPKFFPNPEEFRPERFYGENKQAIVPYSYIPFGEGPRLCIGKRFAKMQSFSGMIAVLRNHQVVLADGMPTKLDFDAIALTTQSKYGINLKFLPRS